eukprot:2679760-Amphidinium_carterae.1
MRSLRPMLVTKRSILSKVHDGRLLEHTFLSGPYFCIEASWVSIGFSWHDFLYVEAIAGLPHKRDSVKRLTQHEDYRQSEAEQAFGPSFEATQIL